MAETSRHAGFVRSRDCLQHHELPGKPAGVFADSLRADALPPQEDLRLPYNTVCLTSCSREFMSSEARPNPTAKVVVATTVALSFISFWRAAAVVLSDLASSAFYAGGAAETAIGQAAPWFVLGVMLFSFAVRSVYMESCSMYVRGGVGVVVRDSMGPVLAKLSISALVFDYILTGPISVVSAGQYMGALLNEISELLGQGYRVDVK